jgi:hypothetical protein
MKRQPADGRDRHRLCGRAAVAPLLALLWLLCGTEAAQAQSRSRGSVSGATRSYNASTSRSVSGNTSLRTSSGQTRSGETVSGSRAVARDGDKVYVQRDLQSSSGASLSKQKTYDFDDGHLDSVSRDVSGTDRYGRSASWEGKAERQGYGWQFEGEGHNRWGQKVEAEGYGARGPYGSGVVADIEGGRYGDRTVVAGRAYGGPVWATQLPYGSRPYTYWGRPYYAHGGAYYRSYSWHGAMHYCYVPPPYYVTYSAPPVGAIALMVAGASLLFADGVYYQTTYIDGATQYQVVPAPAGAQLPGTALPAERAAVTVGGETYFFYGNTFYKRLMDQGQERFVAVTRPAGVVVLKTMPADFEPFPVGSLTYFKAHGRYFLTYLDPGGEELYIQVDAPKAAVPAQPVATGAAAPPAPAAAPVLVPLTLNAGTPLTVRVDAELHSSRARSGDRFQGFLAQDALAQGQLLAPKGSRVYGRVRSAQAGTGLGTEPSLSLELTDIDVNGRILALETEPLQLSASGSRPGRKVVGGAALGAGIGAIVDGGQGAAVGAGVGAATGLAAAAASPGNQVAVAAGTALEFRLRAPLRVEVLQAAAK